MKKAPINWTKIIAVSFGVSFTISAIATYLDWQKNPSGIVHSDQATNWHIVWDTFISWLLPLLALTIIHFFSYRIYYRSSKQQAAQLPITCLFVYILKIF